MSEESIDPVLALARMTNLARMANLKFDSPPSAPALAAARKKALADPRIAALISELQNWPGTPIASHKSGKQLFHKLSFLAEAGIRFEDLGAAGKRILATTAGDGVLALGMNIPVAYGGSGQEERAWCLCDAPTTAYALTLMGKGDHKAVRATIERLAPLARTEPSGESGWPCAVSAELGSWHGPGKKRDPCPYATLIMLRLLSLHEGYDKEKESGVECLLRLWERAREDHPYIFYMGDDFRKVKAPLIWYDILSVLDVLSRYPRATKDPRFVSMLSVAQGAVGPDGGLVPQSVYLDWKLWDFGQKKLRSRWLEFHLERIKGRCTVPSR